MFAVIFRKKAHEVLLASVAPRPRVLLYYLLYLKLIFLHCIVAFAVLEACCQSRLVLPRQGVIEPEIVHVNLTGIALAHLIIILITDECCGVHLAHVYVVLI